MSAASTNTDVVVPPAASAPWAPSSCHQLPSASEQDPDVATYFAVVGRKEALQQVCSTKAGIGVQKGSGVKEGEFVHRQHWLCFSELRK